MLVRGGPQPSLQLRAAPRQACPAPLLHGVLGGSFCSVCWGLEDECRSSWNASRKGPLSHAHVYLDQGRHVCMLAPCDSADQGPHCPIMSCDVTRSSHGLLPSRCLHFKEVEGQTINSDDARQKRAQGSSWCELGTGTRTAPATPSTLGPPETMCVLRSTALHLCGTQFPVTAQEWHGLPRWLVCTYTSVKSE